MPLKYWRCWVPFCPCTSSLWVLKEWCCWAVDMAEPMGLDWSWRDCLANFPLFFSALFFLLSCPLSHSQVAQPALRYGMRGCKGWFFSFFPPVFAENCWISELDGMGGEGHTAPQGVTELSTVLLLFRQVVFMSQNKVHLDLFSFWQNVI